MLGVSNIGMETPLEFSKANNRTSLLFEKVKDRIRYHDDGRPVVNSELVEHMTAEELWENLLLRSLASQVKPTEKVFVIAALIHRTSADAEAIVHRMSQIYKEKNRHSRSVIQSVTEEDLESLRKEDIARDEAFEKAAPPRKRSGAIRWREGRSAHNSMEEEHPKDKNALKKKLSLDPTSKDHTGTKVKFTGAISVAINDDSEEEEGNFAAEQAQFVTLIDVNDSLLKEVLLQEYRRLDEEDRRRSTMQNGY